MKIKDISLNFRQSYIMFYDWLNVDKIRKYENVTLKRVSSKTIGDFIRYNVEIDSDLSKPIIYTDTFSFIALVKEKEDTLISSLLLKDEDKLKIKADHLKEEIIYYKKLSLREEIKELRYLNNIREEIKKEVIFLKNTNSLDKLKYLYYEWFNKKEEDSNIIANKMLEKCTGPITSQEKYIYDLILTSKKLV